MEGHRDGNRYVHSDHADHLPAKVRIFIKFFVERFAVMPPWQRRMEKRRKPKSA
jgi:hypothetical protein